MKRAAVFLLPLILFACAAQEAERREPPTDFPREAVMFQVGYPVAFDRIVQALGAEGYELAIADQEAGVIQTDPKILNLTSEGSPIQYRGVYMIRLDGDSDRSWAVIRFALLPELPGEREKLIQAVEGEEPPSR